MDSLISAAVLLIQSRSTKGDLKTKAAAAIAQSQSLQFQIIKLCIWLAFLLINFKLFTAWLGLHIKLWQLRMAWEMFLVNQGLDDLLVSVRSYLSGFFDGMGVAILMMVGFILYLRFKQHKE
jgi:hypothetical protein